MVQSKSSIIYNHKVLDNWVASNLVWRSCQISTNLIWQNSSIYHHWKFNGNCIVNCKFSSYNMCVLVMHMQHWSLAIQHWKWKLFKFCLIQCSRFMDNFDLRCALHILLHVSKQFPSYTSTPFHLSHSFHMSINCFHFWSKYWYRTWKWCTEKYILW